MVTRHRLKSEAPQRQVHPGRSQKTEFPFKKIGTPVAFPGSRPVVRRRALHRSRDPNLPQPQTVIPTGALRLAGPTGPPQRPVKPAAGFIPREHSSCAVGPVRSRGQAHHNDPGIRISPPRHGSAPISLAPISGLSFLRHPFPPPHQPRATPAGDEFPPETFQAHPCGRGGIRQEARPIQRERWCRFLATIA